VIVAFNATYKSIPYRQGVDASVSYIIVKVNTNDQMEAPKSLIKISVTFVGIFCAIEMLTLGIRRTFHGFKPPLALEIQSQYYLGESHLHRLLPSCEHRNLLWYPTKGMYRVISEYNTGNMTTQ
jgi:hypothetical protein